MILSLNDNSGTVRKTGRSRYNSAKPIQQPTQIFRQTLSQKSPNVTQKNPSSPKVNNIIMQRCSKLGFNNQVDNNERVMTQQQPIQLFYFPTPNGHKITIALEEMQLPYEIKLVDIRQGDQFKPEFLDISPNNRMPAIIDPNGPDGQPVSIFESGAILQYLGRKTGLFYPTDERQRIEVEQWLMWQMGGFGPMLGQNHHFNRFAPEKIPYAINRYVEETRRLYNVLNKRLADRDYVAGSSSDDYSIADMSIIGWALSWEWQDISIAQYPHVSDWIERVKARPAVQRALAQKDRLMP